MRKAFSLIELLITLSLIFILAALTIPRTTFFARYQVTNEINRLFAIFTYLQNRAMATNEQQTLFFDQNNNTFFYANNPTKKCILHLSRALIFGYQAGAKGPPSSPSRPITKAITFQAHTEGPAVHFMSNGKVTPGTVYLVDENRRFMGALTCPISQVSYIRKYFYEQGQWKSF